MKYILSIDQGTTGTRAVVYDKNARPVASAYQEFTQYFPKPGWVEHDPIEIWGSVRNTIRKVMQKIPSAASIEAIGITNQRETTILWDRATGRPVHNAIVWQDRRTTEICAKMKGKGYTELFRKKTGLVIDAYFSGTKIKWLLDNMKGLRGRAEAGEICFGTVDTWLIWKLTGGRVHATDYTNAARTLIFNIKDKKWDGDLLEILKIPKEILPDVKPSSSVFGGIAKNSCGLISGTPIAGDAGDQQAALFGQGCFEAGEMKNTYGTGCFLLLNTGRKFMLSDKGLLTTLACDPRGYPCYALEGSVFIAGAAVQWLRDELKIIRTASETEEWSKKIADTGGVYFVPAFAGLGAPYWDSGARGTLTGITRGTGKPHIIRATLEAIAYQVKDIVDIMQKETGRRLRSLRVDGGASRNDFLMQFQADMLDTKIIRPAITETTAKGAAMLAGLTVGFWKTAVGLKKRLAIEKTFSPRIKNKTRKTLYAGWLEAVRKARSV